MKGRTLDSMKWDAEQDALVKMVKDGQKPHQIARHYKTDVRSVEYALRKYLIRARAKQGAAFVSPKAAEAVDAQARLAQLISSFQVMNDARARHSAKGGGFEDQMERVANGAGITVIPTRPAWYYDFSMTGDGGMFRD